MNLSPDDALAYENTVKETFPSTYMFSKHLAEKALMKLRGDLPFCMTRPSNVINSYKDPIPGWMDSYSSAGIVVVTLANG
mmetsp:Transcript_11189/g.7771  ORF Transcript_11189/g.7771 Transcript_11189/m.7771 type:complete len:80 (+) Transcript_11189:626-865(+)